MARKQWNTTFNEDILKEFQNTCESYGMNANTVLEALMKFFSEGNCKLVIDKDGCKLEQNNQNEFQEIQAKIEILQKQLQDLQGK